MIKKILNAFAVAVFIICFSLGVYYGIAESNISIDAGSGTEHTFNAVKLMFCFMKYVALGLVGGGLLLGLSKLCPEK